MTLIITRRQHATRLVLAGAIGTLLLTAFNAETHASPLPSNRHISTTGYGEVRVKPNTVVIRLEVTATERRGAAAKQVVDERINRFLAAVEEAGIDRDQLAAGQLQVHPRWEYRDQERIFTGYQASRNLSVKLGDLNQLSAIIDLALENGISNVQQLSYEHSEAERLTQEAHQKAVENSKNKAMALAAAYGANLGLVYSIQYLRADVELPPPVREQAVMRMSADMASAGGVYLQEEIVFSDRIQVVFDLTFPE